MKTHKKIAASVATLAMFAQSLTPVLAIDIVVQNNGSDSDQEVAVQETSSRNVTQDNNTSIKNHINLNGDTGSNSISDTTGGESYMETGDASAGVHLSNVGNTNSAIVDNCGDCNGGTSVLVKGNGSDTQNTVAVDRTDAVVLFQTNTLDLDNDVKVDLNTGDNVFDDNTGSKVVGVTGDADAHIDIHNNANANSAVVAGTGNGATAVEVVGNGSESTNKVGLGLASTVLLTQANNTDIDNKVSTKLNTGGNSASDNVAELVGMGTGDAGADIAISNAAGFNDAVFAHCECDDEVYVKVAKNGTGSDNAVAASIVDAEDVFQNNACGGSYMPMPWEMNVRGGNWGWWDDSCFDNVVKADADTGNNDLDDNTGSEDSDPTLLTGDSYLHADVANMAGANSFVSGAWEGFGHDYSQDSAEVNVHVSFDMGMLWDMMSQFMGN